MPISHHFNHIHPLTIYRIAQPLLNNTAFVETVQQGAARTAQVVGTLVDALFTGVGQLVVQQPTHPAAQAMRPHLTAELWRLIDQAPEHGLAA